MKLRVATNDDILSVATIHHLGTHAGYRNFLPPELLKDVTIEKRLPLWRERFERSHHIILASDNGTDIGFAYVIDSPEFVDRNQDAPEISHLFIAPEYWNRGVGRALCDAVCDHVRKHGADRIRLWTFDTNLQARRAYERWGFSLDGGTRQYNYEGVDLPQVRFEKRLI